MALSVLWTDRVSVSTATGAGARGAVAQKETLRTAAEKVVLSNHEFEWWSTDENQWWSADELNDE
jgi:hypothetical protein